MLQQTIRAVCYGSSTSKCFNQRVLNTPPWSAVAWHRFGKSEHHLVEKRCQATALQRGYGKPANHPCRGPLRKRKTSPFRRAI